MFVHGCHPATAEDRSIGGICVMVLPVCGVSPKFEVRGVRRQHALDLILQRVGCTMHRKNLCLKNRLSAFDVAHQSSSP